MHGNDSSGSDVVSTSKQDESDIQLPASVSAVDVRIDVPAWCVHSLILKEISVIQLPASMRAMDVRINMPAWCV